MKVWVFSAGTIDASSRLMTGRGSWTSGFSIALTCVLIDRGDGLVLVDAGWGTTTVRSPSDFPGARFLWTAGRPKVTDESTALGHVRRLGYKAEDVRDVVLTHLDIDHVGGLVDFPNARVHVAREEHAARFHRRQPFRSWIHDSSKAFLHRPRFVVADIVDREEIGFPRSADLFGDGSVMLLDTSGHTPGHCAVLVRGGGKSLVHAGDAFVNANELTSDGGHEIPFGVKLYRRVLHEDRARAKATLARLRALRIERPDIALLNAHDARLLAAQPEFPARFV